MAIGKKIYCLGLLAAPACSLAVTETLLYLSHSTGGQRDALTGWGLAQLFHIAGLFVFRKSIGKPMDKFMLFALGGVIIRLLVLIISVLIVLVTPFLEVWPFILGVLPAYFMGSWVEIAFMLRPISIREENNPRI